VTVTLTATPITGYHFLRWEVTAPSDGLSVGADNTFAMPARPVAVTACFEVNTYAATVNISINGSSAAAPGAVELKQSGAFTSVPATGTGVYQAAVLNGTYDVYVNGEDPAFDIVIAGGPGSAAGSYYTVAFAAAAGGTASGSSVAATANGAPVSGGAPVLAGKQIILTATGAGASFYSYLWSGAGTDAQITDSITIPALSARVDALCTVTGQAAPAVYAVSLNPNGGSIASSALASYTYGPTRSSSAGTPTRPLREAPLRPSGPPKRATRPFGPNGTTISAAWWRTAAAPCRGRASPSGATMSPPGPPPPI
jgi:hypothetical protein